MLEDFRHFQCMRERLEFYKILNKIKLCFPYSGRNLIIKAVKSIQGNVNECHIYCLLLNVMQEEKWVKLPP